MTTDTSDTSPGGAAHPLGGDHARTPSGSGADHARTPSGSGADPFGGDHARTPGGSGVDPLGVDHARVAGGPGVDPLGVDHARTAAGFPTVRPRRLRRSEASRRLVAQTRLHAADLVLPVFVREGLTDPAPIASMPGVVQHSRESLRRVAVQAVEAGIGGVMVFGVPQDKDAEGSGATDPDGILNAALRDLRSEVGDATVLMSDLCLDEFTDHGHCGVLAPDGSVDNDATLVRYADMGVAQAEAGAHMVGPSGMMDGQVGVVRAALDTAGFADVSILAYSAKYASAFYGPFREAVQSSLKGDRRTYQQDPANLDEALREVALDIAEGADVVMVKPALPYLDVLRRVADAATVAGVPVAAYQVSGEYAAVEAAAANGWIDRERAILETLTSIRRAGAGIVLTYWALEVAQLLAGGRAG